MPKVFQDRTEAGRRLAEQLTAYAGRPDVLVLALPRGGVPVAYEVARALGASLDVFVVRKLGVPGHEELAMGAIASGGVCVINDDVVQALYIPRRVIESVAARESLKLERLEEAYRGDRPAPEVRGRTVILIDDGLATGSTMRAAVTALRQLEPARLIVAVPTASPITCQEFHYEADECVCQLAPAPFHAVGLWYKDFSQTTDDQVRELLERANTPVGAGGGDVPHRDLRVP
jgi:predicted phosphoribosyltransferase